MEMSTYVEDFDDGPGGWLRVVDNWHVPAALPVHDSAIWSYGPWWVDYNHAPPGGGYLQLLMCLNTRTPPGEVARELGGKNRFVSDKYPTDFTNARIKVRIRGELESAGTNVCVLVQGMQDGICSGWVLHGQPIGVEKEYTETTVICKPDETQWTCLGSRHDRRETYGVKPLAKILSNVDVNIYLLLFPVNPRPMGPISGDPHILRAGRDYPIWPSSIAQGYVGVDRIEIEFRGFR
jgi:hypothetical protein